MTVSATSRFVDVSARIRARDYYQAVADIRGGLSRVIQLSVPGSNAVIGGERFAQEGPAEPVLNRQVRLCFPGVAEIELIIAPSGMVHDVEGVLGHAFELPWDKDIRQIVAGRYCSRTTQ